MIRHDSSKNGELAKVCDDLEISLLILFGSEKTFQSFKRRAFHRYCDFKPYLNKEKQFVEDRLDELNADG